MVLFFRMLWKRYKTGPVPTLSEPGRVTKV
jgi:hypothetical protein